jgi:hypothetical protein
VSGAWAAALQWGTVADWAVVTFTAFLTVFTAIQLRQNRRTRLMQQSLERARFAIEDRTVSQLPGGQLKIQYSLVNRGRSVASITRMSSRTAILPALTQPPIFPDWIDASEVMQVGDEVGIEFVIQSVTPEDSKALAAREALIHVVGRIEYVDVFNSNHVRAYAFAFDGERHFMPVDAPGYNFET